jgi:hypothetical protein
MNESNEQELLRAKINGETARMRWEELERFFASGVVIAVAPELDLVDVALRMANDDEEAFMRWMNEGRVGRASDAQAAAWHEANTELWAVVVKPWILVQQK